MDSKNNIVFEQKKEDRVYRLEVPQGSNLGELYHVCCDFISHVSDLILKQKEKMEKENKENNPKES